MFYPNKWKTLIKFEEMMVRLGAFIAYLMVAVAEKLRCAFAARWLEAVAVPLCAKIRGVHRKSRIRMRRVASGLKGYDRQFKERVTEIGVFRALILQAYETGSIIKRNKRFFANAFDYIFPAAAILILIMTVHSAASADYGVAVEYSGAEIAVVKGDYVVKSAQKAISDRVVYYDIEHESFSGAKLSVVPVGENVELTNEN